MLTLTHILYILAFCIVSTILIPILLGYSLIKVNKSENNMFMRQWFPIRPVPSMEYQPIQQAYLWMKIGLSNVFARYFRAAFQHSGIVTLLLTAFITGLTYIVSQGSAIATITALYASIIFSREILTGVPILVPIGGIEHKYDVLDDGVESHLVGGEFSVTNTGQSTAVGVRIEVQIVDKYGNSLGEKICLNKPIRYKEDELLNISPGEVSQSYNLPFDRFRGFCSSDTDADSEYRDEDKYYEITDPSDFDTPVFIRLEITSQTRMIMLNRMEYFNLNIEKE